MYIILRSDNTGYEKTYVGIYENYNLAYVQLEKWFSKIVAMSNYADGTGVLYMCEASHLKIPPQYYWLIEADVIGDA